MIKSLDDFVGRDKVKQTLCPVRALHWYLDRSKSFRKAVPGPPTNVSYACPNMNCSVTWDPPEGSSNGDVIYYTVMYQQCNKVFLHGWLNKTECTNITKTACHFGADFDDVHQNWCVPIETLSCDGGPNVACIIVLENIHPANDAFPGPPDVYELESTSGTITISWYAPETPYTNEDGSTKRLSDFHTDQYNMTYWSVDQPDHTTHEDLDTKRSVVLSEINGIKPWTVYKIIIQGRINTNTYGIPVKLTVETKEEVPGEGVTVTSVDYVTNCTCSVNLRQVTVTWLPINEDYWYGNLTHHKVDYWIDGLNDTKETIFTDAMATSIELDNLSRWRNYNIVVQVCNSAGCSPHEYYPYTLAPHSIDQSPPTNTSAYTTSYTSFSVAWHPPISDECIQSYHVVYVSDNTQGEVGPVYGLYAHIENVASNVVYTVYVYADIAAENNSTIQSIPGTTIVATEIPFRWYFIVAMFTAIISIIIVCVVYQCRKPLHKYLCYMVTKEEFRHHLTKTLESKPVIPKTEDDNEYDHLITSDSSSSGPHREAIEIGVINANQSVSMGMGVNNPVMVANPTVAINSTQTQSSGHSPNGYIGESYSQLSRHATKEQRDQEIQVDFEIDEECPSIPIDDFTSKTETQENPTLSDILDFDNTRDIADSLNISSDANHDQPNNLQVNDTSSSDDIQIDMSQFLRDDMGIDRNDGNQMERTPPGCSLETPNSSDAVIPEKTDSSMESDYSASENTGYRDFISNIDTDGHTSTGPNFDSQDKEQLSNSDYAGVVSRPLDTALGAASTSGSLPSYVKATDNNGNCTSNSVLNDMADVSKLIPEPDMTSQRNTSTSSPVESTNPKPLQLQGMESDDCNLPQNTAATISCPADFTSSSDASDSEHRNIQESLIEHISGDYEGSRNMAIMNNPLMVEHLDVFDSTQNGGSCSDSAVSGLSSSTKSDILHDSNSSCSDISTEQEN
ncbi:uncharacterized protein LOC144436455 [Glandiceps talaboti]